MTERVQGRCPACKRTTLFLGAEGYVTCSWHDCGHPTMAADALDGRPYGLLTDDALLATWEGLATDDGIRYGVSAEPDRAEMALLAVEAEMRERGLVPTVAFNSEDPPDWTTIPQAIPRRARAR